MDLESMVSDAALPMALELYCAPESSEEDRVKGLNIVLLHVHRGTVKGLNELVAGHLRPYLTSEDGYVRMRGTKLLATVLQRLPDMKVDTAVMNALVRFFVERFKTDYDSAAPCVLALRTMLELHEDSFPLDQISQVVTVALKGHHVPAMTQSLRNTVYVLMQIVLERKAYRDALQKDMASTDLVLSYADAMEGEKDPRCLLVCLRVAALLLQSGSLKYDSEHSEDEAVQRLFDVTCVYFPIVFRPPSNDPFNIKAEDLWDALHNVFKSNSLMAESVIDLLTDKLNIASSDAAAAKVDSLKTLQICLPAYGSGIISAFLPNLRELLLRLVVNADSAAIADEAAATVRVITRILARQEEVLLSVSDGTGAEYSQGWHDFVGTLVSECVSTISQSVDSMRGWGSGRVLAAVAQSSALGLSIAFQAALPAIQKWCIRPDATETQRSSAFELLIHLIQGINPDLDFLPEQNPISPDTVSTIFEILLNELTRLDEAPMSVDSDNSSLRPRSTSVSVAAVRKTAVEGMQILMVRPPTPLLSMQQARQAVELLSSTMLSAHQTAEARESISKPALQCLVAAGKANSEYAALISEISVPLVESSGMQHLAALADLCAIPAVFDGVMPYMLDPSKLAKHERAVDAKLLATIALILEANKTHTKGLDTCCVPFSNSSLLFPGLITKIMDGDLQASKEALRVLRTLAQSVSDDVQIEISREVVSLFLDRPITFDWISAFTAVAGSFKTSTVEAIEPVKELIDRLFQASVDVTQPKESRTAASQCLASVLNKVQDQGLISPVVDSLIAGVKAGSTRSQFLTSLTWTAKGLAMCGHPSTNSISECVVQVMSDEDAQLARQAALHFGDVLEDVDVVLNRACHAKETLFFRQRYFADNFGKFKALFDASAPSTKERMIFLIASVHLIEHAPRGVLLQDVAGILPLLTQALSSAEVEAKKASLAPLALVLENDLDAVEPFLLTLIPELLDLTLVQKGVLAKHRGIAIDCLTAFAALPYNKIHTIRRKVTKQLQKTLNDPKRAIRHRAVECRNRWLILQNV